MTSPLVANATRLGVIDLHFFGALGAPVDVLRVRRRRARSRLGRRSSKPGTLTTLWAATTLALRSPDPALRGRRDAARTARSPAAPAASARARARSRFELTVSAHARRGRIARIRIARPLARRRGAGEALRRPSRRPGRVPPRRLPRIREPRDARRPPAQARAAGAWSCASPAPRRARRSPSASRGPSHGAAATLLATGDSTMDGIDSFLSDELRRQRARRQRRAAGARDQQVRRVAADRRQAGRAVQARDDGRVDRRERGLADARGATARCTSAATGLGGRVRAPRARGDDDLRRARLLAARSSRRARRGACRSSPP